ncbi:MAG: hypothetical protein GXC73_13050 [Chitinophagaceae bacterium]|nr:hypothetical protein [Chitinophagaceae bacterium]
MEPLSNHLVLKRFEVNFKGRLLPVQLIRLQPFYAPQYYFLVTVDDQQIMITRTYLKDKPFWIGGGVMSVEDIQMLGPEIEKQLGNPLPPCESNNPFEYEGDLQINVEKIMLGELLIEKAKAPYSADLYYRIHTSNVMIEVAKFFDNDGGIWVLSKPSLGREQFNMFTELIDLYEESRRTIP